VFSSDGDLATGYIYEMVLYLFNIFSVFAALHNAHGDLWLAADFHPRECFGDMCTVDGYIL
jgi:hypothetical protein